MDSWNIMKIFVALLCAFAHSTYALKLGDLPNPSNFPIDIPTFSGIVDVLSDIFSNIVDITLEVAKNLANVVANLFELSNIPEIVDGITTKCCGKYGCFTMQPPFGFTSCRLISFLPKCQSLLNVSFLLWTRENRQIKEIIDPEDPKKSNFRKTDCVVIVIDGVASVGDGYFPIKIKEGILNKKDCMFISVDWSYGSFGNVFSVVADAQMVSAVTAYFIKVLVETYGINASDFYLIGLSIGAHIVGGVGKRIPGIGRITGVDPAKPFYEYCDATVRLSRTDAIFVDIIHTDGDGVGTRQPSGHVDVYVNGGRAQPACFGFPFCSHPLAAFYYIDSLEEADCPYLAYQCDDFDNFMRGKCSTGCGENGSECVRMGYYADEWRDHARQSPTLFFNAIGAKKGFCVYHYYVEINCTDDEVRLWRYGRNTDKLYINLIGQNGETGLQPANEHSIRYTTLPSITTLIISDIQIGQIISIILKWETYETVPPNQDCQNVTEPTDIFCCIEIFDSARGRCLMCPYIVSTIFAKNLETDNSAMFDGRDEPLIPNTEISFSSQ